MCRFNTETSKSFSSLTSKGRLRVKLKTKKQHEIDRLVNLVELIKENHFGGSLRYIFDIGAGMGHLSRLLSVSLPGCSVIAVEKNDDLIRKSVLLNKRLRRPYNASINVKHRCESVQAGFRGLDISEMNGDRNALLIGLHSCGDLSSSILRLFVESENVTALILLGCCYHKHSVINMEQHDFNEEMPQGCGFPLSLKYRKLSFTRSELDLACHGNESLVVKLLTKCYRAVLECLIANQIDEEVRRQRTSLVINSVDSTRELVFEEYTRQALSKYPGIIDAICTQIANDDNAKTLVNSVDVEWRHLLVVNCLRLLFAPIIEHIIIEDRVQFLHEHGHSAFAVPLFDPRISPRNFAVVAFKDFCNDC